MSLTLHVGLLLLPRVDFGARPDIGLAPAPRPLVPSGMEVISLRVSSDAPAAPTAAPSTAPVPERPASVDPLDLTAPRMPPLDAGATPAPTPARDRFSEALEALRPRLLDPRLRPGNADALRTDSERAALRVYARIHALNDSILAAMERERASTDWTWTDEDGRRWGISPGKLHLGGVEIPLPLSFSPTADQRERAREWAEIQAQAEQGAIDETFADRVEAIRERREAERNSP